MSREQGGGDLERVLVFALSGWLGAYLHAWFAQWFVPSAGVFMSMGRIKGPQMTQQTVSEPCPVCSPLQRIWWSCSNSEKIRGIWLSINSPESTDLSKQNREKRTESQTHKYLTSPGSWNDSFQPYFKLILKAYTLCHIFT